MIVTSTHTHGNVAIFDGDINKSGKFMYGGKTVCISKSAEERADIVLIPTAMPGYPCIKNDISEFCSAASLQYKCVVAMANRCV